VLDDMDIDIPDYHQQQQDKWFIPEEYKTLDIEEYISQRLPKDVRIEAVQRISIELEMYRTRNLYPILQVLIYIIDTMRNNDIVWGVGRGSSVASYVLYILGVHKVDSLKYNLDIKEFLKDE
jgi:DNA polymerase III alpha subunit